jgi:uncharacterized protein YoxC
VVKSVEEFTAKSKKELNDAGGNISKVIANERKEYKTNINKVFKSISVKQFFDSKKTGTRVDAAKKVFM